MDRLERLFRTYARLVRYLTEAGRSRLAERLRRRRRTRAAQTRTTSALASLGDELVRDEARKD